VIEPLVQALAAAAASPQPDATPDTKPLAQLVFIVMGLSIATVVLVAGLLAIAALRRHRHDRSPARTAHVDAWAEAGRRAGVPGGDDDSGPTP